MTSPEITDAAVEAATPKGQARKIAWDHFQSILAEMDKSGVIVPKELAMRTDYFAALRALADDIEAAISAALAAGRAEAVAVRELDWSEADRAIEDRPIWLATNAYPLATYSIEQLGKRFWLSIDGSDLRPSFPSLEAAKGAAQADFEARIRSALVPAEAVAADKRYIDENGTVWVSPTPYAYAMVCKALERRDALIKSMKASGSALVSAPAAEAEPAGCAGTVGEMFAAPSASQEALREAAQALADQWIHYRERTTLNQQDAYWTLAKGQWGKWDALLAALAQSAPVKAGG